MRLQPLILASLISLSAFAQQNPPWSENLPVAQRGSQNPNDLAAPVDEAGPGVARMSFLGGDVSVRRGDSGDAVAGALNAPLLVGDSIATGPTARAEVQFDSASRVRLGSEVEARVAELQRGKFRMEVAHGTVSMSLVRDTRSQTEISAPNVSMRPLQRGLYRITVGDDGQTSITVRYGQAEVFTQRGTEKISQGQTMMVRGTADDPEFQIVAAVQKDDWDTWNEQRDQQLSHVKSNRYMNQDIEGGEELDASGSWISDPAYGQVWSPRVDSGWAPYQQGRWVWEDYYGWTWLSTDSFGWAPYHYGNWYYGSVGWCWYPGPVFRPVFWRPALVAFFGFGGFGVGLGFGGWGHVGWLPLAPFEAFHPWYGRGIGAGNYHVTNVNITNIYRNARVNGAMSGVAANSFSSGRFGGISHVTLDQVRTAGLVRGSLPIAPSASNLRYSDRSTSISPGGLANSRFVSRSPTSGAPTGGHTFEQQRQAIQQSTQRYSQSVMSGGRQVQSSPSTVRAGSGWDGFGNPNRTAAPVATSNQTRSVGTSAAVPGWSRFGSPSQPNRESIGSSQSGSGYPHFGGSGSPSRQTVYGGASSQSLRLSPSIVHNRSYDQPYSGSAYRSQTYSAPRTAPRGYSVPTYSAPRAVAPAVSRSSAGGSRPLAPAGGSHSNGGSSPHTGGGNGNRGR